MKLSSSRHQLRLSRCSGGRREQSSHRLKEQSNKPNPFYPDQVHVDHDILIRFSGMFLGSADISGRMPSRIRFTSVARRQTVAWTNAPVTRWQQLTVDRFAEKRNQTWWQTWVTTSCLCSVLRSRVLSCGRRCNVNTQDAVLFYSDSTSNKVTFCRMRWASGALQTLTPEKFLSVTRWAPSLLYPVIYKYSSCLLWSNFQLGDLSCCCCWLSPHLASCAAICEWRSWDLVFTSMCAHIYVYL